MVELYTFAVSHFAEKARWALDLAGVAYQEKLLLPGPHMLTTRRLAPESSVPILVHEEHVVQGSSAILDHVEAYWPQGPLGARRGNDTARHAEEATLDRLLGTSLQRLLYAHSDKASLRRAWCAFGPAWAKTFYALAFTPVDAVASRMYRAHDPVAVAAAEEDLLRGLDQLDSQLAQAPYLAGDRAGRSDLVMAALLAPLDFPPEHPAPLPGPRPPWFVALLERHRGRPALAHVARVYRELRHLGLAYRLGANGAHLPY